MPERMTEETEKNASIEEKRENAPKTPPDTLHTLQCLYISGNMSVTELALQHNVNVSALKAYSSTHKWSALRRQYLQQAQKKALARSSDVLSRLIQTAQTAERNHYQQAIDQLERARDALNPDDKQYLYSLKLYTDARSQLQRMQYRSLGISESANSDSGKVMIFNNYPQRDIIRHYKAVDSEQDPPRRQETPPYPMTQIASEAVDIIEKPALSEHSDVEQRDGTVDESKPLAVVEIDYAKRKGGRSNVGVYEQLVEFEEI